MTGPTETAQISLGSNLPNNLMWLADAPAFIDADQVARFHDAVVRPVGKEGTTTHKLAKKHIEKLRDKVAGKGKISVGTLLQWIGLGGAELELGTEVEKQFEDSTGDEVELVLSPIDTPERQLEHLTAHYLLKHSERLFLVNELVIGEWCAAETIEEVPRGLAFLNLPSLKEAGATHISPTTLVPIAAEFANGVIETFFDKIPAAHLHLEPPAYPDHGDADYSSKRKAYWHWFFEHLHIQHAVTLIEEAAKVQQCRIQWIDYRVPVGVDGESLHLHVVPAAKYDTGTFAYMLIRRGYEHGLRLVGSLKSDPALNVLAIYER